MSLEILDIRDKMLKNPDPKRIYHTRKIDKIKRIVVHCDDWDTDVWTIAKYDVTPNPKHHISVLGCPGFTYHFFTEKTGTSFYCEDISKITWHAGDHNADTIGICLRYKATGNDAPPPFTQLDGLYELLVNLSLTLNIDPDNILGHRELIGTGYIIENGKKKLRKTCPGLLVNMDIVRYDISCNVQTILAEQGLYTDEVDGVFGPKSEAALASYAKSQTLAPMAWTKKKG